MLLGWPFFTANDIFDGALHAIEEDGPNVKWEGGLIVIWGASNYITEFLIVVDNH
jgi:hypothetical protein